ncbi:MAG: hypothetical protein ACJA01_000158 [Saprospiraceae bacterium]|jgi:hypothetical protein
MNISINKHFHLPRLSIISLVTLLSFQVSAQNTWTGTASGFWFDAANWSGGIPSTTDDMAIPITTNAPIIMNGTAMAKSLTVNDGASLTINGPATLIIDDFTLKLRTEYGSISTLTVVTQGIFAIWWDPAFDHAADAHILFQRLSDMREDCLNNLNMQDPPNPAAGYFYNIYIHHGANDQFPAGWGNGQGTDMFAQPFLTLPTDIVLDFTNTLHEGFHVFQYSSNSPGFAYAGDSQWYTESAAQWYASIKNPTDDYLFRESAAKAQNPQLALWHSFSNSAPGDPIDWLYEVQQYGLQSYFFFLSNTKGVNPSTFAEGFYNNTTISPQEFLYHEIGGTLLRGYFTDWAAHNTGGFDYLTPIQVAISLNEIVPFANANPQYLHPFALELTDQGTNSTFSPQVGFKPRGWGYNVIKINNSQAATYTFNLNGDSNGSEGAVSHFEARLVIKSSNENAYDSVTMTNATDGSITKTLTVNDTELYLVIAAVPEHWSSNQTYSYSLDITKQ